MANYQLEFTSKLDGQVHELERRIAAPIDRNQHTYRLNWNAAQDSYEIEQDGELYSFGSISVDFSGFPQSRSAQKVVPKSSDVGKADELARLREEIKYINEYVK
eukprot:CAMPEP_0185575220 /NCGR_PEP_ID=MMETSP0434-20130131/6473_1 /TAXON_ID=626734 ORGANISM="Favella taraikaensis, Strain Fe Narragansett Bay" /NCGR_SAMPLE_ID=MMETSP0434 /ASSEMBLY_ACC=CAM_ASM_000379 /LENGTH=103 /DNA_ID=CAMNT_0028192033 /DNA_START=407 /DNA_END=718 /DNA_ORIENTATION=+